MSHGTMRSTRTGGNMLHFEDFPPGMYDQMMRTFEEECARHGSTPRMQLVND
jgi:hypothetical protein